MIKNRNLQYVWFNENHKKSNKKHKKKNMNEYALLNKYSMLSQ